MCSLQIECVLSGRMCLVVNNQRASITRMCSLVTCTREWGIEFRIQGLGFSYLHQRMGFLSSRYTACWYAKCARLYSRVPTWFRVQNLGFRVQGLGTQSAPGYTVAALCCLVQLPDKCTRSAHHCVVFQFSQLVQLPDNVRECTRSAHHWGPTPPP